MISKDIIVKTLLSFLVGAGTAWLGIHFYNSQADKKIEKAPQVKKLEKKAAPMQPVSSRSLNLGGLPVSLKTEYISGSPELVMSSYMKKASSSGWEQVNIEKSLNADSFFGIAVSYMTPQNRFISYRFDAASLGSVKVSTYEMDLATLKNLSTASGARREMPVPEQFRGIASGSVLVTYRKGNSAPSSNGEILLCESDSPVPVCENDVKKKMLKNGWLLSGDFTKVIDEKMPEYKSSALLLASKDGKVCNVSFNRAEGKTFISYRISEDISDRQ